MELEEALKQIEELQKIIALETKEINFWSQSYTDLRSQYDELKEENRRLYALSLGLKLL
jgi:hypothetical protein